MSGRRRENPQNCRRNQGRQKEDTVKTKSYSAAIVASVVVVLGMGVVALELSTPGESAMKQSFSRANADGHWAAEAMAQIKRCKDGDGPACFEAGTSYESGRGVEKSQETASDYFVRACDMNFAGGCAGAAMLSGEQTTKAEHFL